jgi:hypothetical protein
MTTMSAIRAGIATNLATIPGLRTSATIPDDPKPPIAIVSPESISFDTSMGRGLDTYQFTVLCIVGRVSERTAQNKLDTYCNPTGASSVKTAIESNRTLSGACNDLRVVDLRNYGDLVIADITYLAAEFRVAVFA